jgi:hypothetical protein
MCRVICFSRILLLSTCLSLAQAAPSRAAWPVQGRAVGDPEEQLGSALCPDGSGGVFVAWFAGFDGTNANLRLQRFTADGGVHSAWPNSGVLVGRASPSAYVLAEDGAGGAFILWTDYDANAPAQCRLTHIGGSGTLAPGSPPNGQPVYPAGVFAVDPSLLSDLNGGVFASWSDMQAGDLNVRVQHFDPDCAPLWAAAGVPVRPAYSGERQSAIVRDGAGGLWVGWIDEGYSLPTFRASALEYIRLLHHVTSSGLKDPNLPANGIRVGDYEVYVDLRLTSDGAGGVYALWNGSDGYGAYGAFAQRYGPGGTPVAGWPAHGFRYAYGGYAAVADGAGGVLAVLAASGPDQYNISLQRIRPDATITPGWDPNGTPLGTATNLYYDPPQPVPDGQGGATVVWADGTETDLFARHVSSDGTPWASGSETRFSVCAAAGSQTLHHTTSDGAGGAYVSWNDDRSGTSRVYVTRVPLGVFTAGVLPDTPSGSVRLSRPRPNPARERVEVVLTLPAPAVVRATVLDVSGRLVCPLRSKEAMPAGSHSIAWDGRDGAGREAPAGIYVIKVYAAGQELSARIVHLR